MDKQGLNLILTNLENEGLTPLEAYIKLRKLLVTRLAYSAHNAELERRCVQDIDTLDSIWFNR